jgi:hypothetical protein
VADHRPPLGGAGLRRVGMPDPSVSTIRQPDARYTITRFTERDFPNAEFGPHSRHTSTIDDSCHAVVDAWRRWPRPGGKQRRAVLDAGLVLDPLIGSRLASLEVMSVTQLGARCILISLAGESLWEFDHSAGEDLVVLLSNDGTLTHCGGYLPQRFDPRTRHLDIEAVLDPDGPAAQWVATVVSGEPVTTLDRGRTPVFCLHRFRQSRSTQQSDRTVRSGYRPVGRPSTS